MTNARAMMNDSDPQSSAGSEPGTSMWHTCAACGHWQKESSICTYCQWPRLIVAEPATANHAICIRVLIETEFRSDGSWHLAGLRTARLPDFFEHDDLRKRLADAGVQELRIEDPGRKSEHQLPTMREWKDFRDHSRSVLTEELNKIIIRSWPAPQRLKSPAVALVSIRTYILDPETKVEDISIPDWLEVITFPTAAASAASKLHTRDIVIDCSNTDIAFSNGSSMHIEAAITSPSELLVTSCELMCHPKKGLPRGLWRGGVTRVVRRNERTALPLINLSAETVRGLAPDEQGKQTAEFKVFVLGKEDAITATLPTVNLPSADKISDLLLDLGSTDSKWALRHANGIVEEHDQDTRILAENWGLEPYRKADFIADPKGELWGTWISRALPVLRHWIGREHTTFLRNIYVSLPATHGFDIGQIRDHFALGAFGEVDRLATIQPLNSMLVDAFREHLVDRGRVFLIPEHRLLAAHYLTVLKILAEAAKNYSSLFDENIKIREQQNIKRSQWDAMRKAVRTFEDRSKIYQWFHQKPSGPSGSRPSVTRSIANPAEWMKTLCTHPQQLEHVVLLDAGGLSLDISVLQKHSLLTELSYSDATCGGEEISSRIGRKEMGAYATRYKAGLGKRWFEARERESGFRDQIEYREVTRSIYEPSLQSLFEILAKRWRGIHSIIILITGGGSRNPHFAELVTELAANNGIEATSVDARIVHALILEARQFPEPLSGLDSAPIMRFEETQRWSETRERQLYARYDKFAVVGGMCALIEGDSV